MSKKYFINNLDTSFGKALLDELVKEPTEDSPHMCTLRVPGDAKPANIKKVLKREKPKLFRKKIIEECDVYVYNVHETDLADVNFGIETMLKPFEDSKVFILVSDIMAWTNSGRKIKKIVPLVKEEEEPSPDNPVTAEPVPEKVLTERSEQESNADASEKQMEEEDRIEEPVEYTFWEQSDYAERVPHESYQYLKQIEDKVLSIKRENVKVYVVCPGVIYGCGEDTFYPLFRAAWLQQPEALPFLGSGANQIPTIHLKDLARFVIKIAESPPEGCPYLLACDETVDRSQKAIVEAISKGIGCGKVATSTATDLIKDPERYMINIDMRASKLLIGTTEQPVQFQWSARKGVGQSIKSLLQDFTKKERLRPIKLLIQNDPDWKDSKIDYILHTFSEYYRVPVLTLKGMLTRAKQFGDQQLIEDLKEEWEKILDYINGGTKNNSLDETMKVLYRAIRWRLTQNDCVNRGFILDSFPRFYAELDYVFAKIPTKKFKRIRPKQPKPAPVSSKKIVEGEEELAQEPIDAPPEQEPPKEEEDPVQDEAQNEDGPKFQSYYPETLIQIKQAGHESPQETVEYFTSKGMEELIYDATNRKEHEIFESLRIHIERNGRPNNYLVAEEELLRVHQQFIDAQNKRNLGAKKQGLQKVQKSLHEVQASRHKLAEEIYEVVRTQGEEQIKKMPFRNYLMEFVVPTLNVGLLQVSNIIPDDPVDLLAEFLFQRSYQA